MLSIQEQCTLLTKGVAEIINLEELKKKLELGRKLTIKLGLDPTAPDIHLGHTVVLRKIKQFQDLGHQVVIIIGDMTGRIGDPTGRDTSRPALTKEEVMLNAKTYTDQIFKILDPDLTEVKFNSEWLEKLSFEDVLQLASKYSVARMLEREDFKNRFKNGQTIGIHEFFYPLMQGFDSISIKADIEIGGTDQTFNILMGRTLQKEFDLERQVAIFMPILEGTDGKMKMSKSKGNYIGIDEKPSDMFGKIMSIQDQMIIRYFELVTDWHPRDIKKMGSAMDNGELNPMEAKMTLGEEIVSLYHGKEAGRKAKEEFITVFRDNKLPDSIQELVVGEGNLIDILVQGKFAQSKSEARRLILQGGVRINGEKIEDIAFAIFNNKDIIQVGKRKFAELILDQE
ncbi:tyrosine--tRNA ligase [Vallitalea okinawensis]|uniref:tyrosine--tRNA ligase n=1 Tax=Vallitalea okinawensis TaxID=2078660 RepID=UPI000CFAFE57|nr:tyrosine--tRNA ligase [Vallitalea okinawensis]